MQLKVLSVPVRQSAVLAVYVLLLLPRDGCPSVETHRDQRYFQDDLRPISCQGHNSQGGVALTLIDSLSTLMVMNCSKQVLEAVQWMERHLTFDIDQRVHVFELTIRAIGGLLSTHVLLHHSHSPDLPYSGSLLNMATDLVDRLLPAFDTESGIPLSWITLRQGVLPQETRFTCTACAGTLLLEFGTLSRLTGNPVYEQKARHAMQQLFGLRSPTTGLVGNVLHTDSKDWAHKDSGIGAGIDSFYEYLLKAYLLFGDEDYLGMFTASYLAAMHHLALHLIPEAPTGTPDPPPWLTDAHMETGKLIQPWISSLSAFWPGLQALSGQVTDAARLLSAWVYAWKQFGALPELFDISATNSHPLQKGYPLRPELMESTYMLYAATHNPDLLHVGRILQASLAEGHRQKCGYASLADVVTGELEDSMESFFLSETTKYLFLLHANATDLPNFYVFTTEGHLLPPFMAVSHPAQQNAITEPWTATFFAVSVIRFIPAVLSCMCKVLHWGLMHFVIVDFGQREVESSSDFNPIVNKHVQQQQTAAQQMLGLGSWASEEALVQCTTLCADWSAEETAERIASLHTTLPLLPFSTQDSLLLRQRRCIACLHITNSMAQMRAHTAALIKSQSEQQCSADSYPATTADKQQDSCPASSSEETPVPTERQVLCMMKVLEDNQLQCEQLHELMQPADVSSLPDNAVLLKQQPAQPQQSNHYTISVFPDMVQHNAIGATFGRSLPTASCNQDKACHIAGQVIDAQPSDACLALVNGDQMTGAIVLVDRGACSFTEKAFNVYQVGAAAIVVVNNVQNEPAFAMGDDQMAADLDITAMMVTRNTGRLLREGLQRSAETHFVSVQAKGPAGQQGSHMSHVATEHHVYVPEATQSWLQKNYAEHHGKSAQTWQVAVTELMTSVHGQLRERLTSP